MTINEFVDKCLTPPEGIRFIQNTPRKDRQAKYPIDWIEGTFDWGKTYEGHKYWVEIYVRIRREHVQE